MTTKKALFAFLFWVGVAAVTNLGYLVFMGPTAGAEFFGAWVMEQTLSLDNLFMFYFIFNAFDTPPEARARVLKYGVAGVILMRGAIILGGTSLLARYHFMLWFFALFLGWAAWQMLFAKEDQGSHEEKRARLHNNWLVRIAHRFLNFDERYHGDRFWIRNENGRWQPTMLLLVVLVVEGTDIPFAFDSLPAAMAISQDFAIVASSNLLAVMGLRSIYFLIENMQERFSYMGKGIAILLGFAAAKILMPDIGRIVHLLVGWAHPSVEEWIPISFGFHMPLPISLGIIVSVIIVTILYTLWKTRE